MKPLDGWRIFSIGNKTEVAEQITSSTHLSDRTEYVELETNAVNEL